MDREGRDEHTEESMSKKKAKTSRQMAVELEAVLQMKDTADGLVEIADRLLGSMGKDFRKGKFDEQKARDMLTLSNAHVMVKTLHDHYWANLWK